METIIITNIVIGTFFILIMILSIWLSYSIYRTEMKRKSYVNNIKVGDKVWFPVSDNIVNSVVEEIDGDNIKVSIVINRKRLNPN